MAKHPLWITSFCALSLLLPAQTVAADPTTPPQETVGYLTENPRTGEYHYTENTVPAHDTATTIETLEDTPHVVAVSEVHPVHPTPILTKATPQLVTPATEPYYANQWAHTTLGLHAAHTLSQGASTTVAVLDSPINVTHEDLFLRTLPTIAIQPDNTLTPIDHGSHVAGIIAASVNELGVEGVAPNAQILPVHVLDGNGYGTTGDVAQGILQAVEEGADIINMSLASESNDQILEQAVNYAVNNGVLVVVAAGNEHQEGDPISYPAAYPNVIAVAATDPANLPADFSTHATYVDVAAPGTSILSTYYNGYGFMSGTSMASPHVSGVAALLHQLKPDLTPDQFRTILQSTAVDVSTPGVDVATGYGIVNPVSAIQAVSGLTPNPGDEETITARDMKQTLKAPRTVKKKKKFTVKGKVYDAETGLGVPDQPVRITYWLKQGKQRTPELTLTTLQTDQTGRYAFTTKVRNTTFFTAYVDTPVTPYNATKPSKRKIRVK